MKKSTKSIALLTSLVLITSCFVGGTIARYVTSTSSEDSARVAVWGINDDGVSMDLFNATYELADGTIVAQSNDGDKIIAPGTHNESPFSIVNTSALAPEVMYEIKIDVDDTEIDPLILSNPGIQWRLDNNDYGTWEECKADILALSGDASGSKLYNALDIPTEFATGKTHTIGWQWLLDSGNDALDTQIGNEAAIRDITAKISIKITAIQSDGNTSLTPTVSPVANTSWKMNDTLSDFSQFTIFRENVATNKWQPNFPDKTRIKSGTLEHELIGFARSIVPGSTQEIDYYLHTVFSGSLTIPTITYLQEGNSLGLPGGWKTLSYELVSKSLDGETITIEDIYEGVADTEAPTISFPTDTTTLLENDEFIDWLKANATKVN